MADCLKESNQMISLLVDHMEVNEIGPGDSGQVVSQAEKEWQRCEMILNENDEKKIEKIKREPSSVGQPASEFHSLEVYAIVLNVIAIAVGCGLKMSIKIAELVQLLIRSGLLKLVDSMIYSGKSAQNGSEDNEKALTLWSWIKIITKNVSFRNFGKIFLLMLMIIVHLTVLVFVNVIKVLLFEFKSCE